MEDQATDNMARHLAHTMVTDEQVMAINEMIGDALYSMEVKDGDVSPEQAETNRLDRLNAFFFALLRTVESDRCEYRGMTLEDYSCLTEALAIRTLAARVHWDYYGVKRQTESLEDHLMRYWRAWLERLEGMR